MPIEDRLIALGRDFLAGGEGALGFLLRHWAVLVLIMLAAGMAVDWTVWVLRFPPEQRKSALLRRALGRHAAPRKPKPRAPGGGIGA